jgi:hypothetical protein
MGKRMTLTPPNQKKLPTAEQFIKAANRDIDASYPWDNPKVREDVIKSVNLRLSEPYILKLQWLAEKTHKSQQELIREALLPWIDAQIEELV